MHINDLLKIASERKASDLHLKVGSHPVLRINGELIPLVAAAPSATHCSPGPHSTAVVPAVELNRALSATLSQLREGQVN